MRKDSDELGGTKWVWSDADFEEMSFHDVTVYALGTRGNDSSHSNFSLLLDIDYIVSWLCDPETRQCSFAVSPATLVFEHTHSITFDVRPLYGGSLFQLNALTRVEAPRIPGATVTTYRWALQGHDGASVALSAWGFKMYLRRRPVLVGNSQALDAMVRGGISFAEERADRSEVAPDYR